MPARPRGTTIGSVYVYAPLEDTANRLGYTIYGIDVPGLQGPAEADAQVPTAALAEIAGSQRLAREDETRYALNYASIQTGGKALFAAGSGVLGRVVEDTRSYYWLGFTAPQKGDDQRYRVDIDTTRPDLKVRTRKGFEEVSKSREVTMAVESALLFGSPPSSRPLQAAIGKPEKSGRSTVRVPVTLTIPADAVTFLPIGDGFEADLEIRIAAMDERGHRSSIPVVPYRVAAKHPPVAGDVMRKETVLELRREKQDIVVAIYDRVSGNLLSSTLQFTP